MKDTPLFEHVAMRLLRYIRSRGVLPGEKLPGVRSLSKILNTSKNTVSESLELLQEEGLVEVRKASGSYVTKNAWIDGETSTDWEKFTDYRGHKPASNVIQKVNVLKKETDLIMSTHIIDGSFGHTETIFKAVESAVKKIMLAGTFPDYEAAGPLSLRKILRKHLKNKGIDASVDQIIISPSGNMAIETVVRALSGNSSRCRIYAEKPFATMLGHSSLLYDKNISVKSLPSDKDGVSVAAVRALPSGDSFLRSVLILNPTRQYLTYRAMSNKRKREVLESCSRLKTPLVEVDYMSDLSPSLKPIKSMDSQDNVIYIGTLNSYSQVGIKVAWIVAPKYVVPKILDISVSMEYETPSLNYTIVEQMIERGYYADFLKNFDLKMKKRVALVNGLLDKYMSDMADWDRNPGYGVFWIKMKPPIKVETMFKNRKGIMFLPGSFLDPDDKSYINLTACALSEENMEKAVKMLSELAKNSICDVSGLS